MDHIANTISFPFSAPSLRFLITVRQNHLKTNLDVKIFHLKKSMLCFVALD